MTFKLEAAITRKVMKLDDRRQKNGDPAFREKPCTDHEGRKFVSRAAMARYWKTSEIMLTGRLKRGWDMKTALTAPAGYRVSRHICTDHEGRQFSSQKAMCEYWGVSDTTYSKRIQKGLTVKQALTARRWYQHKEDGYDKTITR